MAGVLRDTTRDAVMLVEVVAENTRGPTAGWSTSFANSLTRSLFFFHGPSKRDQKGRSLCYFACKFAK